MVVGSGGLRLAIPASTLYPTSPTTMIRTTPSFPLDISGRSTLSLHHNATLSQLPLCSALFTHSFLCCCPSPHAKKNVYPGFGDKRRDAFLRFAALQWLLLLSLSFLLTFKDAFGDGDRLG